MSLDTIGDAPEVQRSREIMIRMQCIEVAKGLTNNPSQNAEDVVNRARTLAKWVLTGKTGKEEE